MSFSRDISLEDVIADLRGLSQRKPLPEKELSDAKILMRRLRERLHEYGDKFDNQ